MQKRMIGSPVSGCLRDRCVWTESYVERAVRVQDSILTGLQPASQEKDSRRKPLHSPSSKRPVGAEPEFPT